MKNNRVFYSNTISQFLVDSKENIIGAMAINNQFDLNDLQRNSWEKEIEILKEQLNIFEGRVLFEYTIPRMGKRVDVVLLINNIVFLLEFKVGADRFASSAYDQVYDYALDLKNFQKESHDKLIVPILVATEAKNFSNRILLDKDDIIKPLFANKTNIKSIIQTITGQFRREHFDYNAWENSFYMPTPTIIEAAQALYAKHEVKDITRSDAGAQNLSTTTEQINQIIEKSQKCREKSIIFVTGVPGAGKTLVGLNLASSRQDFNKEDRAVFLSGNAPLVEVLIEALARDKINREKSLNKKLSKKEAEREAKSLIQIIHKYRDSFVGNDNLPSERIAIFDESQRAWTKEQISNFMLRKKGKADFSYSEPEFLISTMNRLKDWAVVVCLVGGGQEINKGEAGLPEWFESLRRSFSDWKVYVSDRIEDDEYLRGYSKENLFRDLNVTVCKDLHLSTSIRSFRSEKMATLVKAILDIDKEQAKFLYDKIKDNYPIYLTRDLNLAKEWIKGKARGTERYGLICSSGALRLKPCGIFANNKISSSTWFLNDKDDVRSSYYLEDVASEFDIQGLELDYTIVAWDANFRYDKGRWSYHKFSGTKWQNISSEEYKLYLKNAYRVLLTRARQGMVIYVPYGDIKDHTRLPQYYDGIYNYLRELGIETI